MCADSRGSAQPPQEMRSNGRNGFSGGARARSGGLPARVRSRASCLGVAMSRRPVVMCRPQLASSAAAGRGPRLRRPGQPPAGYRNDSLLPGLPRHDRMAAGRRRHQPGSMMRASPVTELCRAARPASAAANPARAVAAAGSPGAREALPRDCLHAARGEVTPPAASRPPAQALCSSSRWAAALALAGCRAFARSHNTAWNSRQKVAESPEAVRSLKRSCCCYSSVATYLTAAAQAR